MRLTLLLTLVAGLAACGDAINRPIPTYDVSDAPRGDSSKPERQPYVAPEPQPFGCVANQDAVITQAELPIVVGARLTMRVGQNATVDTAGTVVNGVRVWDFGGQFAGDRDVTIETAPVLGQWFDSSFPKGEYTVPLSGSADTLGVMKVAAGGLLLQGMASPVDGPKKTNLVYDAPIPTLGWPLQLGTEWAGKGVIDGYFEGTRFHCGDVATCTPTLPKGFCCLRHSYASKVDAVGQVVTPYQSFPVQRVKTTITYETAALAGAPWTAFRTVRAFAFVTECFGTVAVVTSRDNEAAEEFTTAAEVRRLAP